MLITSRSVFVVVMPLLVLLGGCVYETDSGGRVRDEPVSVDLGHANQADVELEMAAGELTVRGGAQKLLEGHFEYNVEGWRPKVSTSTEGSQATISIREPEGVHHGGNRHYRWDLDLNNQVLLDLSLNCGAGRARLDLGDLDLRSVRVQMGAGQVDLDLRGHPTRDYDVNVSGGVGQATIRLPDNVGVRAEAHGGLGSIEVSGLEKRGDYYENSRFGSAKANIRVKVEGGIGQIRIIG